MKIIYLHQYFNTPEMSGGTRSYEMARRLVEYGHEVHIITSWREETDHTSWFETQESGISVHWLPVPYSNHLSYSARIKAFLKFAIQAIKKANSISADLIFATSTPLTIAIPAVLVSKKKKIPMVFEVRDLWPELPIAMGVLKNPLVIQAAKFLENWAYKNSKAVVALSPGMRDGIKATGYPKDKIVIIPNSSDNELFTVSSNELSEYKKNLEWYKDDTSLIIYTGTFGIINGVSYLVHIAKEILKYQLDIKILLVGDGKEFNEVESLAKEFNVLNINLFMMKKVPKNEIPYLIGLADISTALFIDKPEMRSNSANKFFDSLAASKPVMINYGGWMADLIKENDCGMVAWQKDISEVAKKLVDLIQDKDRVLEMGMNSKRLAETQFDRDFLAKDLEDVFHYAVDESERKPIDISSEYY